VMRKIWRYSAIVELLSSVSHIGETAGTESPFRREKVVAANGDLEEVPIISGNSIRGQLRDAGARQLLETLGISVPLDAFYMLFSGGSLTKSGGAIDIGVARDLRAALPFLSVFGAATGTQMLPGLLKCGKLVPVCQETAHLIPDVVVTAATDGYLQSVYDIMQTEDYTRKDDAKDERLRGYLAGEDAQDAPQQMRYTIETMSAGTKLWWHVTLEMATDLENAAFRAALSGWGQNPVLGGMGRIGHGLVRMIDDGYHGGIDIDPSCNINVEVPDVYLQHLHAHRDEITALLDAVLQE